jgi:hypothetical protein
MPACQMMRSRTGASCAAGHPPNQRESRPIATCRTYIGHPLRASARTARTAGRRGWSGPFWHDLSSCLFGYETDRQARAGAQAGRPLGDDVAPWPNERRSVRRQFAETASAWLRRCADAFSQCLRLSPRMNIVRSHARPTAAQPGHQLRPASARNKPNGKATANASSSLNTDTAHAHGILANCRGVASGLGGCPMTVRPSIKGMKARRHVHSHSPW